MAAGESCNDLASLCAEDLNVGAEESFEEVFKQPEVPSVTIEDDRVPMFPAPNSAQRQAESSRDARTSKSQRSMLARELLSSKAKPSMPSRGTSLSLQPPMSTPPTRLNVPGRNKVALQPGCSPLDWARIKNTTDLRVCDILIKGGITTLLRVTPSELKQHNTRSDAWTALDGKVYNITPYLQFHPGGTDTLMRVAGRDGTRLFYLTHSWVNIDAIIGPAMTGVLVPENS
ncbi:cytochrome-b5 reductase [Malassezia yamatoensis]|uniref:Cytochrome-b5 reductase n=1 Tax=Malassezia yamatoensis TaxID=253288 RepID=A0AAJ5YS91_9BASI|nr:cytochrome-b5 reductase [Malassezia yamatoensis]